MSIIQRVPWRVQPRGPVGINRGNPLTRGMVVALAPSISNSNIALPDLPDVITRSGAARHGVFTTSSSIASTNPALSTTAFSFYALFLTESFLGATTSFLGRGSGSANNTGFGFNSYHSTGGYSGAFYVGTSYTVIGKPTGGQLVADTLYSIGGTYDGTNGRGYNNGVLTVGPTAGSTIDTTARFAVNRNTNTSPPLDAGTAKIFVVLYWNRALSSAEMAAVHLNPWQLFAPVSRRLWVPSGAVGITQEGTGTSGDVAAANTWSGPATWTGTNRGLGIDVPMLGPGVTVTSMTYGGANCTKVGSIASVTSFGAVEQWRIVSSDPGAPAAGSNTLVVNLSGSIEFAVNWESWAGVHQTSPTEGYNSAQATNVGAANDASVAVTSVADNCWIQAACVANDTSITAGNTSRQNVSGTLGSGATEDNGAAKTPAGAVTMSYSGMGITTTWAISGYAWRPLAAANLGGGFFARWWYDMIGQNRA